MPEPPDQTRPCEPDSPEDTLLMEDLRVVLGRRSAGETGTPPRAECLTGRHIGKYTVGPLLGEGGMARVYRASDTESGGEVAFKVLKPEYRADEGLATRFEREARGMARIQHENVVRIFDFPRSDEVCAITMELLTGGSLRTRMAGEDATAGHLAIAEAVDLVTQAARGLAAAHAMGMVHRDVKPANLLLDGEGRVKVADFGAILVLEQTTWLTGVGQQIGTPRYMSPEQCKGERVTPASDVYSLGTTLFELVTGRLPFVTEEASPFAIMLKHLSEAAPDARMWRDDVPDWLATVISRCLEKHAADRYATAKQLVEALEAGPRLQVYKEHDQGAIADTAVDMAAIRDQLRHLPQRAIVCWACRCARRVQDLNPDPRVERALQMAEEATFASAGPGTPDPLSHALSRVRALRLASLKAAYADDNTPATPDATESARAAAAAAACAAARCIEDAAADAAFAARSAVAALVAAQRPVKPFWHAARGDFQTLLHADLGLAGTIGRPIPPALFDVA